MNRWTHPLPWLQEQVDILLEKTAHLEAEIKRLDAEKAGKRGPKPKLNLLDVEVKLGKDIRGVG